MTTATRIVTTAGTTLAVDGGVAEAPTHTDVWRGRRNFFFAEEARTTSKWAMAIGGLLHIAAVGTFAVAGYPTWRWAAIGLLWGVFSLAQRLLIRRADKKADCMEGSFIGMNLCAQVFVTTCAALTGSVARMQ